ncbi:MAG: 4Fe-4S dicluster domain-containing protein [Thermomicrobiales bacterium]|nr:4Fe-4S dicluster domain-containing protein [Thermomicrobiales bacterium]
MCLSSCPTYRITGLEMSSPRGRLWLMSGVSEGRVSIDDPTFQEQMYQCLNCRACEAVCPSGVQYGPLLEASRYQIEKLTPRSAPQRAVRRVMLDWAFKDVGRIGMLVRGARLYKGTGAQKVLRKSGVLKRIGAVDADAMTPDVRDSFMKPGKEAWKAHIANRRAMLFSGCIMGTVFAGTNRAAGRVMARNGIDVSVPVGQGCCGALMVHSGMFEEARELARRNIDAFESSGAEAIVITAAGCGSTLKEYGHLLHDDPEYAERAKAFADRVVDVTQILAEQPLQPMGRIERTVTYQDACHLAHAQRITAEPRKLLKAIPGLELVEMKESSLCCGSAGIYNLLRPEMAKKLGDRKAVNTIDTHAAEVVTANPGCAMQLKASLERNGSTIKVTHIVDLLDEAYAAGESQAGVVAGDAAAD